MNSLSPFFFFSHTFFKPRKNLFSSLLFSSLLFSSLSLWCVPQKKNKKMAEQYPNKETENFFEGLRMEMKKLSKFFFLETKTNNSNLISTSNSNTERFFFQTQFLSLSLFCCYSDVMECCVIFDFVLFWWILIFISFNFSHFVVIVSLLVYLFFMFEWLCCVILLFLFLFSFYSFFNNFLFIQVWMDCSSLCCLERF